MVNIEILRIDYALVRKQWADVDGWSAEELAEADCGIKAAVEGNDVEQLACWANWIAGLAEEIRRFESTVRDAEGRMREQAEAERRAA